jgi:hypothetical protein
MGWPIREAALAYINLLRQRALEEYWHSVHVWAVQSPYIKGENKPPAIPKLLRSE